MKEFPPFRLDIADQTLWRDNQRVPLTPKAFAVLQFLVERAGRLVTLDELLETLWPDTFVQPEVLKSQILDVRAALGDKPKDPRFIETVPRRGYRFIAAIREPISPKSVALKPLTPGIESPSAKMVGRDDALAELRRCFHKAEAGERQIVLVTGEQGMGKTTLMESFLQETNASFARGQCLEGFGAVKEPYYPVLEALGQLSRGPGSDFLTRVLEQHAPTWLIQLPALLKKEHRETLERELLGATRERMIREMCEALERLTEDHPLVVLFEDLHWSDHSTVDLLSAVAYRRVPARLLLIGTYRPVDIVVAQHPLKEVSLGLKAHRLAKEITLSPLTEGEIAEYLSAESKAGADIANMAHWIRKQTEGNPLFMVTMIEHLTELGHFALADGVWSLARPFDQIEPSVPDTLRQMIELQIEKLSPREQLALDVACVQGTMFSAALIAAALEVEEESVEDSCQKLARAHHMVRMAAVEHFEDGHVSQRYEFVHAVFRSVLYHRLSPSRRAKLHRRIAEALELRFPAVRSTIAVELASHFEQCADWSRAIEYLWMAARNAWRRFDYREALSILQHALQCASKLPESERKRAEIEILQSLAVFHHGLHDASRVISSMENLAERSASYGMPYAEAQALLGLATMRGNQDTRLSLTLLDRVQALDPGFTNHVERAEIRARCATLRMVVAGWDVRLAEELESASAVVREGGDRLAAASIALDECYLGWVTSRYAQSVKGARETLPILLEGGRVFRFLHGRDLVATNLALLGQWGKALDILDESIENARKNEAPSRVAMPQLFKAWIHLNAMDYAGAVEMCEAAMPNIGPFMVDRRYIARRLSASAALGLGRHDEALEHLLALRDAVDQHPVMLSWYWRMPLELDLVDAWLAKNKQEAARRQSDRALALALGTAERTWQSLAWDVRARVAMAEGDYERARQDVHRALETMADFDVPLAAWRVHATAAIIDCDATGSHRELSREVIRSLAGSLDSRPELQRVFLKSLAISQLLGIAAKA